MSSWQRNQLKTETDGEGKMDAQLVRDFLNAMNLRESADYEAEFSQSGAEVVIASAKKFIEQAATILDIGE